MRGSSMMRWIGVAVFSTISAGMAACGSGGAGGGTTGSSSGSVCTPGATQTCVCAGAKMGAQSCAMDGRSFGPCDCGSGATSGAGGAGGSLISTGTQMSSCGDGIKQPGECNPGGEFYCPADCGTGGAGGGTTTTTTTTGGTGGACAGQVIYADKVDFVASVWSGGHGPDPMNKNKMDTDAKTGVAAGDAMCNHKANGSHACDYNELVMAKDEANFKKIPSGTTAWVQRSTAVVLGGQNYPAGKGARCDDWTYATDHLNDGEWVDFQAEGVPTYHLDMDPNTIQASPKDAPCGHNDLNRSILCCYPCE